MPRDGGTPPVGSPPPAGAGAGELLDWLGSLRNPGAHGGEGRRRLARHPAADIIASAAADPSPQRILGAVHWAGTQPDDLPMARVLVPHLRRLL